MSPAALVQLVRDGAMLRADDRGDADGAGASGLFVRDVRIASRLRLGIPGRRLATAARTDAIDRHRVVLVPELPRGESGDLVVTRDQRLSADGLHGAVSLENPGAEAIRIELVLEVAADFEDPFALRATRTVPQREPGTVTTTTHDDAITWHYAGGAGFTATSRVHAPGARLEHGDAGASATWSVELPPRGTVRVEYAVTTPGIPEGDAAPLPSGARGDLTALRMEVPDLPGLRLVGAGAPWFLTLFGRDSLLTARLAGDDAPGLLVDTLRALAATQAHDATAGALAAPGRMIHEMRFSELAVTGRVPFRRYYGSVDVTPLFLVALGDASNDVARELEPAARAAAAWLLRELAADPDGAFLRYVSDPGGLIHQGWKDSDDAVCHRDGTPATGAIALVEVQGYAFQALRTTARLARAVWADAAWAEHLDAAADRLRSAFRERFWSPEDGVPALALDGAGERVAVVSSNIGHLLGTRLLDPEEERIVADRLLDPDLRSGFGLRTLSTDAARYHPLSYHNGSVWPHDTMVVALGLRDAGMLSEARALAAEVVDATAAFDGRLPELFGGFARATHPEPVAYRYAARPQAWAAAASLAAERLLGR